MRVVTMKQQATLQVLSEAVLASGTASGIWSEDAEWDVPCEQQALSSKKANPTEH